MNDTPGPRWHFDEEAHALAELARLADQAGRTADALEELELSCALAGGDEDAELDLSEAALAATVVSRRLFDLALRLGAPVGPPPPHYTPAEAAALLGQVAWLHPAARKTYRVKEAV